jgi:hypothetical protein
MAKVYFDGKMGTRMKGKSATVLNMVKGFFDMPMIGTMRVLSSMVNLMENNPFITPDP